MSTIKCPRCHSSEVLVYEEISYWINTGERFCSFVKAHDKKAKVRCMQCDWEGKRRDVEKQGGDV